jgi:hypothetical protein
VGKKMHTVNGGIEHDQEVSEKSSLHLSVNGRLNKASASFKT